MTGSNLFFTEALKLRRSKVPVLTLLAFGLAPLAIGFLMLIFKDPEGAKRLGLIAAKAQMTGGSADWQFLFYITKAIFIAGAIIHAVLVAYVFGREYAEGTAKNMLTLPVSRPLLVINKYLVVTIIFFGICAAVFLETLLIGFLVRIPGWDMAQMLQTLANVAISALLITATGPFVALFAMIGKGYIAPIGFAMLSTILVGQLFAHTLWGRFIPWSMLFINAGAAGTDSGSLGVFSYSIAGLFFVLGIDACAHYLKLADNHQ